MQDGKPVTKGIIDERYPLNLYFAYGIKNSLGTDFDPITKLSVRVVSPIFSFGRALGLVRKVLLQQDMRSH